MEGKETLIHERKVAKDWGLDGTTLLDLLNGGKAITKRKAELAALVEKNPIFNLVFYRKKL
jgi:hypothetical protein